MVDPRWMSGNLELRSRWTTSYMPFRRVERIHLFCDLLSRSGSSLHRFRRSTCSRLRRFEVAPSATWLPNLECVAGLVLAQQWLRQANSPLGGLSSPLACLSRLGGQAQAHLPSIDMHFGFPEEVLTPSLLDSEASFDSIDTRARDEANSRHRSPMGCPHNRHHSTSVPRAAIWRRELVG